MKHNFGAGPGILPQEVLKQAAEGVMDMNGIGLSILEISHRSADFEAVLDEAISLVKELLEVPEGYSVLFLQGGASTQFAMAPYNLLPSTGKAAYVKVVYGQTKLLKRRSFLGKPLC
jgi:phosphoserine aminotransferase